MMKLFCQSHNYKFIVFIIFAVSASICGAEPATPGVEKQAFEAAVFIEKRVCDLTENDFSLASAGKEEVYGGLPISKSDNHLNCLKTEIRAAFAEITLAQEQTKKPLGNQIVDLLINSRSNDFFGTKGHIEEVAFNEKFKLIEKLASEEDLRLSDRLFLLLKGPDDDYGSALRNWLERSKKFVSPSFLTSKESISPSNQARLTRELVLFSLVLQSQHLDKAKQDSPRLSTELQNFITNDLNMAVRRYSRNRFESGGPLRDRSLPVLFAAQKVVPGLGFDAIGVCRQKEVEKLSLAHARGLASLTTAIDAEMADTQLARKSIGQIIHYKIQPFYIGSLEVREKGVLSCAPDKELETILANADFFGRNGHFKEEVYNKRVTILEQLFLKPSSLETRDFLFALKSPKGWLDYFDKSLIKSDDPNKPSCLQAIEQGQISKLNLKNLFLARCMLSHDSFNVSEELSSGRARIIQSLESQAKELAVNQYIKAPGRFNHVDVGLKEIEKFTEFNLASLSIPTYNEYLNQKKDYNWAIASIPRDFISLADPNSSNMLDNEVGLFESDYIYRTGKFDKKLNPNFVKKLNEKLEIIVAYRDSQFTPPDTRRRRGFEVNGAPINELKVKNHIHPDLAPSNPQLHDLLEGTDGGFGGLGELFLPEPKGYEKRQSALDAIASSPDLKLGETLFRLALDAGVQEPTTAQKAEAARKWLNYFDKTQSIARFHSTPDELKSAMRGAFVCRLVMQTESFLGVIENSKMAAVNSPEDISTVLDRSLTNQVRIVNSILSAVDPSTALNKDIDYIKERWYDMKAWHTESMKWLETIVADPSLMSEVTRIRSLSERVNRSYDHISPAISKIERTLASAETRIVAERNSERRDGLFKPIDFANLVMGQLVTIENATQSSTIQLDGDNFSPNSARDTKLEELSRQVTDELFNDIRASIDEAGFNRLSEVNSLEQFPTITRAYYNETDFSDDYEDSAIHELLLHQLKGAVAKAKGNIEAERVTDLNTLEDLSLRASRADRIFFSGDPDRYALLIDPSFLLHEWNNRHKIKTIAEFRTVETRAQAQTQIFRYRKLREKLEEESVELDKKHKELETRLGNARKWAQDNDYDFNPDSVIDEMLEKEDEIDKLKAKIIEQEKIEEKYRQHHFFLAQQLNQMRTEGKRFDRAKQTEYLLSQQEEKKADTSQWNNSSSSSNSWQGSSNWQAPKKTYTPQTYTKPTKKYASSSNKTYSSSGSNNSATRYTRPQTTSRRNGGLLQRIFGRNR